MPYSQSSLLRANLLCSVVLLVNLVLLGCEDSGAGRPSNSRPRSTVADNSPPPAVDTSSPNEESEPSSVSTEPGVIEGTVLYTYDDKRPWRFGRYYVDGRNGGPLSEAVIALRGPSLKDFPSQEPGELQEPPTIDQQSFRFVPEVLAVHAGEEIRFTNSDATLHNVRTDGALDGFNVNLAQGDEHLASFARAGGLRRPVTLGCVFHGGMRAWIYVFNHPYFHVTGLKGRFQFADVPPGEYELEMVHPAGELKWKQKITLAAGQTLNIDIPVSPDNLETSP